MGNVRPSPAAAPRPSTTASAPPRLKQRLVLCLDGTWNDRDDCTNVYHLSNLIVDGEVQDGAGVRVRQRVRYFEGVGTKPLDRLSGGGFGFGLEKNVRQAYDWLIEAYSDGDKAAGADEIFVFGFSRGAFTARSLVGFIASCGLLRRGAPLTVNQLWQGYCLLGRARERREGWWERVAGARTPPFRRITSLVADPWHGAPVPTPLDPPPNATEQLLMQWSRRVPIQFLGVFDTVGAIGFDALAIPGLRSRLALQHNMHPTRIVQRSCHAIAIDEHRGNFAHTPFVEYLLGHEAAAQHAHWQRTIRQRWFVGAHANVGGGYPDNELAMRPLAWMLEGARQQQLVVEPLRQTASLVHTVRDSFAEFARPLWIDVLRAKRNWRRIDPHAEVCALPARDAHGNVCFRLQDVDVEVDDSVLAHVRARGDRNPPLNLVAWARTAKAGDPDWQPVADLRCTHQWLDSSFRGLVVAVAWAALAAAGWDTARMLFDLPARWCAFAPPLAAVFALADWAESRSTHGLALQPDSAVRRAVCDSLYWLRAAAVILFPVGVLALAHRCLGVGWAGVDALAAYGCWETLPLWAGGALLVGVVADRPEPRAALRALAAAALAAASVLAGGFLLTSLAQVLAFTTGGGLDGPPPPLPSRTDSPVTRFSSGVLMLQFALPFLLRSLWWADEGLRKARLGSIVRLQLGGGFRRVERRLAAWRDRLVETPDERGRRAAADRVRTLVRSALWRNLAGVNWLYLLVLGFGTSFAANALRWPLLRQQVAGVPLWALAILVLAVADVVEDVVHLHFVRCFDAAPPRRIASALGVASAIAKWSALLFTAACSAGAVLCASGQLVFAPEGWRGALALLLWVPGFAVVLTLLVAWGHKQSLQRRAPAPRPPAD
jgi:uncharacterized protein (DUF2235 family)